MISSVTVQVSFDEIGFKKWSQSVGRSVSGAHYKIIFAKSIKKVSIDYS